MRILTLLLLFLAPNSIGYAQSCVIPGGISFDTSTQRCAIIGSVPPGLRVIAIKPIAKLADGNFEQSLVFELAGGFSPPRMVLAMKGDNILHMRAMALSGQGFGTTAGNKNGLYFTIFQDPLPGEYGVTAITKDAAPATFMSELH